MKKRVSGKDVPIVPLRLAFAWDLDPNISVYRNRKIVSCVHLIKEVGEENEGGKGC